MTIVGRRPLSDIHLAQPALQAALVEVKILGLSLPVFTLLTLARNMG